MEAEERRRVAERPPPPWNGTGNPAAGSSVTSSGSAATRGHGARRRISAFGGPSTWRDLRDEAPPRRVGSAWWPRPAAPADVVSILAERNGAEWPRTPIWDEVGGRRANGISHHGRAAPGRVHVNDPRHRFSSPATRSSSSTRSGKSGASLHGRVKIVVFDARGS